MCLPFMVLLSAGSRPFIQHYNPSPEWGTINMEMEVSSENPVLSKILFFSSSQNLEYVGMGGFTHIAYCQVLLIFSKSSSKFETTCMCGVCCQTTKYNLIQPSRLIGCKYQVSDCEPNVLSFIYVCVCTV